MRVWILKEVMEKVEELHAGRERGEAAQWQRQKRRQRSSTSSQRRRSPLKISRKLQFQVGEIIACEEVKKSRKLLCSQVKIGSQVQTDRIRYQGPLYTGGNGRQKGHGTREPEAGKTGRRSCPKVCCCAQKTPTATWHS